MATESKQRLKRGRPIGSKDKQPRKSKRGVGSESIKETVQNIDGPAEPTQTVEPSEPAMPNDPTVPNDGVRDAELHGTQGPDNQEISINYIMSGTKWNRNDIDVDDIFAYKVALEIMEKDEDLEPTSIYECMQRSDWIKWKEAINVE